MFNKIGATSWKAASTETGTTHKTGMSNKTDVLPPRLGWRKRGGGAVTSVEPFPEANGSSKQFAGLFPFHAQVSERSQGIPLGRHVEHPHPPVLWDPVTAFRQGDLTHPSFFIIGGPAKGKSETAKRFMVGLRGRGVIPLCFGDTKSEHGQLIKALGGEVFTVGPNADSLNVLDPGGMWATSKTLHPDKLGDYLAEAKSNRLSLLAGLIEMNRSTALLDYEASILSRALAGLDKTFETRERPPVLSDLVDLLAAKPEYIWEAAVADGSEETLNEILNPLRRSIIALIDGPYGNFFSKETTTPLDLSKPLCISISGVADNLLPAILWACWVEGFNSIASTQAARPADAPPLNYLVVIDELWKVLQSGSAMIKRLDALVRLDRYLGVATMFVTHGASDLESVATQDIAAAKSLISKMGAVGLFGLEHGEISVVNEYLELNEVEQEKLLDWSSPLGVGKMLLKVDNKAGTPVEIVVPPVRKGLGDTNSKWAMQEEQPKQIPAPLTPRSVPLPPVIRSRRVGPVDAQTTGPVPGITRQRQPVDVTAPPLTPASPETVANIEPPELVESSGLVESSESLVEMDLLTPRPLRSGRVGFRAVSLLKRRVGIAAAPVEPVESLEELSTRVGLEKEEG